MKQLKLSLLGVALALTTGSALAQNTNNKWYIGVGAHAVDFTSVDPIFSGFFDTDDYSIVPPLSKLTIGRTLGRSFAVDISASVGEVDYLRADLDSTLQGPIDDEFFLNAGLGLKYKFANGYILNEDSWFDPYLRLGANYVQYDFSSVGESEKFFGASGGLGINFWIVDNFGLNVESNYNHLPTATDTNQDFFQHSAALVFRFGGKDTDGDGVVDSKDACPDVAGLKEFDGCPDTDTDGIIDSEDACPDLAGPKENNGCPDTDSDGVFDNEDDCPEVSGPKENNGCPWKDSDNDGILDKDDACANEQGPKENNGCPWKDSDSDGVFDNDDKCPSEAGPAVNDGCPLEKGEVEQHLRDVKFQYNSEKLTTESVDKVKIGAELMNGKFSGKDFYIDGHSDSKGSESYNLKLSEKRAQSVVNELIKQGVDGARLTARGFGESKPIATNDTEEGRASNRRVEVSFR